LRLKHTKNAVFHASTTRLKIKQLRFDDNRRVLRQRIRHSQERRQTSATPNLLRLSGTGHPSFCLKVAIQTNQAHPSFNVFPSIAKAQPSLRKLSLILNPSLHQKAGIDWRFVGRNWTVRSSQAWLPELDSYKNFTSSFQMASSKHQMRSRLV
jgi:hypothetical protein